jgi:hypothetical protein
VGGFATTHQLWKCCEAITRPQKTTLGEMRAMGIRDRRPRGPLLFASEAEATIADASCFRPLLGLPGARDRIRLRVLCPALQKAARTPHSTPSLHTGFGRLCELWLFLGPDLRHRLGVFSTSRQSMWADGILRCRAACLSVRDVARRCPHRVAAYGPSIGIKSRHRDWLGDGFLET